MGTALKVFVIALAIVGLCVMLTTYIPIAFTKGWELPVLKIHVTWAVTAILALLTFGLLKLKYA
jgi:hypothetical protein